MDFLIPLYISPLSERIRYSDHILLVGSCFTEHMAARFTRLKFSNCSNSHGILFNPLSIARALTDVADQRVYTHSDLFLLNEYWHSWYHHSDFSDLNPNISLQKINDSISTHHAMLKKANYLFITLGSSFAYNLVDQNIYVSNNHRAPAAWFRKDLLSVDVMKEALDRMTSALKAFNPGLKIIYTVSPVRHIRDGVVENNRSKARLIELAHSMENSYYFPAYELLIDVLRDYRFYDADLVHPNYAGTAYVWEQFVQHCIDHSCYGLMEEMDRIFKAANHKPFSTESQAHKEFMKTHAELCLDLQHKHPHLDLNREIEYFKSGTHS
ncbi:MAG: GSCFA domain-containing protein [Chitinophagaceae bacterium]|nr:GSCFA domain-containing protein [Chitinophagaceae bacterium]